MQTLLAGVRRANPMCAAASGRASDIPGSRRSPELKMRGRVASIERRRR